MVNCLTPFWSRYGFIKTLLNLLLFVIVVDFLMEGVKDVYVMEVLYPYDRNLCSGLLEVIEVYG